jgi:hypothetical protein
LVALALSSGSSRKAADLLAGQGLTVSETTLRRWANDSRERYEAVRREVMPRIREQLAEQHSELAQRAMEVETALIERLRQEQDQIPTRELHTNIRDLSVAGGIATDKGRALRGDPDVIVQKHESFEEIRRALRELGVELNFVPKWKMAEAIEGDAEEVAEDG